MMWQLCCGERAGSHINLIKNQGRTLLGNDLFNDAIFNTFNMPHLHELDLQPAVRKWQQEGHRMGTTKAGLMRDSFEASSEVVRRRLAAKTSAFLFK